LKHGPESPRGDKGEEKKWAKESAHTEEETPLTIAFVWCEKFLLGRWKGDWESPTAVWKPPLLGVEASILCFIGSFRIASIAA
jgi:hypothetical protein